MSDPPVVSVVVPALDDAADLRAAVASVLDQEVPGPVEVIIAVGPSHDATDAVARQLAAGDDRVHVVDNPRGRTSCGLNAAIDAARGSIIARVDARTVLPPGYLARAVSTLRATGAANVGGAQVPVGATAVERAVALAMRSPLGAGGARYRRGGVAGPADTVFLGVFDRGALELAGGFDETLERNQDYELNWRLRQLGRTVWFDPGLEVRYRPRGSIAAVARQYASYGRWKCEVVRRHPRSLRLRQLVPPLATAALAVSALVGTRRRAALAVPAAYASALTVGGLVAGRDQPVEVQARVPVVLATMQLAWGSAFLVELVRRSLRGSSS